MNIAKKAALAGVLAVGVMAPMAVLTATPALAQSNCAAGTWGGIHGWGDCRGQGKWQLKLSCTGGASKISAVLTGPGHVDLQCPWGSARTASIVYL